MPKKKLKEVDVFKEMSETLILNLFFLIKFSGRDGTI